MSWVAAIKRWRLKQSLGRTWQRRPDLLSGRTLDAEQQRLLIEHLADTLARIAVQFGARLRQRAAEFAGTVERRRGCSASTAGGCSTGAGGGAIGSIRGA